jgi:hypothetical protein
MPHLIRSVITGCVLTLLLVGNGGAQDDATTSNTADAPADVPALEKQFEAAQAGLAVEQKKGGTFRILGDIKQRTPDTLVVWGKALGIDVDPSQPGWLMDEGNIQVEGYDEKDIAFNRYTGIVKFVEQREGKGALGQPVTVNVYGKSADLVRAEAASKVAMANLVRATSQPAYLDGVHQRLNALSAAKDEKRLTDLLGSIPSVENLAGLRAEVQAAYNVIYADRKNQETKAQLLADFANTKKEVQRLLDAHACDDALSKLQAFQAPTDPAVKPDYDKLMATVTDAIAARDKQVADQTAARDKQDADNLADLAKKAPATQAVLDQVSAFGAAHATPPPVRTHDDLAALVAAADKHHTGRLEQAKALMAQVVAIQADYGALVVTMAPFPRSEAAAKAVVGQADAAKAALDGPAADIAPILAYHRAFLASLPATVTTPDALASLGARLDQERLAHPDQWTLSVISTGYDSWWSALMTGITDSADTLAADPDKAIAALHELGTNDPAGVKAGRYTALVEKVEDAIGKVQQANAGPKALATVNAWSATWPLGLSRESRRHHIDLLNRFNGNVTAMDVAGMKDALDRDQAANPEAWVQSAAVLPIYATLQARQAAILFGPIAKDPSIRACAECLDTWDRDSRSAMFKDDGMAWDKALRKLDPTMVAGMGALAGNAALSPDAKPPRPPGFSYDDPAHDFWKESGDELKRLVGQ